jgi:hypothetical protein
VAVSLKRGDKVEVHLKENEIVNRYRIFDEARVFEIVATDNEGYCLYVPHYLFVKETIVADITRCLRLEIDPKFLNENIVYVLEDFVISVKSILDGMSCKICQDFFAYAEGNQEDGSLICFSCRSNPWR